MNLSNPSEIVELEYKSLPFESIETKKIEINGVPVGVIKGLASTFGNIDKTDDIVEPGAFTKTLKEHKKRHDRPIRMLFMHDRAEVIGGFPIDKVKETAKGLQVEGHINLDVQKGAEAFSLAKMGVLSDLSIGFIPVKVKLDEPKPGQFFGTRHLKEIDLREISIVDEPANPKATITDVKKAAPKLNKHLKELAEGLENAVKAVKKAQHEQLLTNLKTINNLLERPNV